MKKTKGILLVVSLVAAAFLPAACGGKGGNGDFPDNFDRIGDAGRLDYVIKHASPDSVARFICDAALGKVEGARIDTVINAVVFVNDRYAANEDDMVAFSNAFDSYSRNLPLPEKMRFYALSGQHDPQRLGYQLGVEYILEIRNKKMAPDQVAAESSEFRKACASDPETYSRFVKGFKVVLEMERNNGLDPAVYSRFINLSEK